MTSLYDQLDKSLYKLDREGLSSLNVDLDPSTLSSGSFVGEFSQGAGILKVGKRDFTNTEAGYILGVDNDVAKFFIGDASNYMNWDGSSLTIIGALTVSSGTIGGFTISATAITATNLTLDSAGQQISLGSSNDIIILDADDATYRLWVGHATAASAPFSVTKAGAVTASNITITGGSVATSTLSGTVSVGNLDVANRGWVQTCAFSVTDADTVAWGSGTFTAADGTAYSIGASNTGNMAAKTYIYLDTAVSTTAYQTTTTATTAVGAGKVLVAIAQNATGEATFTVMNGQGGQNIDASSIVAGSITANEIAASTITAGKMSVSTLAAITADMGAITAGTITLNSTGHIKSGQTAYNTGTGFWLGIDSGTPKFSIGDGGTSDYMAFDGTNLIISGTNASVVVGRANAFFNKQAFIGRFDDGFTEDTAGGTVTRRLVTTYIATDATTSSNAGIRSDVIGQTSGNATYKWNTFNMEFVMVVEMETSTNQDAFWGVLRNGSGAADNATSTILHIGFYLQDGTLYASNADGTTQTKTSIAAGVTITNPTTYRFVYTLGVDIKFYADDTLLATHTTNLPVDTTVGQEPTIYVTLKTQENVAKEMAINNNYIVICD